MNSIYKIGSHCFCLSGESLMEAVDSIHGFRPFVRLTDTVSPEEVGEDAWSPEFVVREGDRGDFLTFQRKSYSFGYEDVTASFGVSEEGFLLELAPDEEPSLYLRTLDETREGKGICLYGNYSPRL